MFSRGMLDRVTLTQADACQQGLDDPAAVIDGIHPIVCQQKYNSQEWAYWTPKRPLDYYSEDTRTK
jgi:hypothetical protein